MYVWKGGGNENESFRDKFTSHSCHVEVLTLVVSSFLAKPFIYDSLVGWV